MPNKEKRMVIVFSLFNTKMSRLVLHFLWITFGLVTSVHVEVRPTIMDFLISQTETAPSSSIEADPDFVGPIQNVTVAVGREAVLSCTVTDLGTYRVGWMKAEDQTILTLHTRVVTHNSRISVSQDGPGTWQLRIRQLRESDRGCYMCQINTTNMKKQLGCIDVHVPPDISDGQTSGDVTAQEGDNSTLVCHATGRPQPRIVWRREDGEHLLVRKESRELVRVDTYPGDSLTLIRLDRRQMGAYLCIASNDVPPAVSKRITLNVNFPPVIKVPNQILGTPLGTDVHLQCLVEAYPNTINYWVKNRADMLLSGKKHVTSEQKMGPYKVRLQLTINNFNKRDIGTYMCVATNSLGKSDGTIRLYEIKLETTTPKTTTSTTTEATTTTTTSTTAATQLTVVRRKVLIVPTTPDPRSRTRTTEEPVENNLIMPSDRSSPNGYLFNYASSGASQTLARLHFAIWPLLAMAVLS